MVAKGEPRTHEVTASLKYSQPSANARDTLITARVLAIVAADHRRQPKCRRTMDRMRADDPPVMIRFGSSLRSS